MALFLYRALKFMLFPIIFAIMAWRMFRGREDKENFAERLGQSEVERPESPLIWLHGASVGEVVSMFPVLQQLRTQRPSLNLLLTTGTTTGRRMLLQRAPSLPGTGKVIIQYVPLDTTSAVKNFLNHWKPNLSVFTESEFWPELLSRAPHPILINGRISDRSWPRYQRWKWLFTPTISRFKLAITQRQEDADRLQALGAPKVQVGGNIKFDADPLPYDAEALEKFKSALEGRPVLVAASTHPGEEEIIAQMHMALKSSIPQLLTIIVPRHPHRGTQAANDCMRHTKAVRRRGLGEMPVLGGARHTDIYIADSLGELGLWYRMATVAIVGGSLVPVGGHNPVEPLKLGIPTLTGPHMFNFQDMVPLLTQHQLLTIAPDVPTLTRHILTLLTETAQLKNAKAHITSTIPSLGGSARNTATTILDILRNPPFHF